MAWSSAPDPASGGTGVSRRDSTYEAVDALLDKRLANIAADLARLAARIAAHLEQRSRQRTERDTIRQAIAENGGDRIQHPRTEWCLTPLQRSFAMQRFRQETGKSHRAGPVLMSGRNDVAAFIRFDTICVCFQKCRFAD